MMAITHASLAPRGQKVTVAFIVSTLSRSAQNWLSVYIMA